MPLAAFGGKRAVMEQLAPLGPVYQAGTLSGNPVATACGLATLREIAKPGFFEALATRTRGLVVGLLEAAQAAGVADDRPTAKAACSASSSPPSCRRTTATVMATDKERFNRFFHAMLDARRLPRAGALRSRLRQRGAQRTTTSPRRSRRRAASFARKSPLQRGRPAATTAFALPRIVRCTCTSSASAARSWAASPRSRARPGTRVTGCDANVYPPMSDQLRALGIELIEGYDADQLAARARPVRHRQRDHARQPADGGDPRRQRAATRAGRSGSPTTCSPAATCSPSPARTARPATTSMLAWILEQAGLEPGFLVGGVPLNFGVSARLGDADGRRS